MELLYSDRVAACVLLVPVENASLEIIANLDDTGDEGADIDGVKIIVRTWQCRAVGWES